MGVSIIGDSQADGVLIFKLLNSSVITFVSMSDWASDGIVLNTVICGFVEHVVILYTAMGSLQAMSKDQELKEALKGILYLILVVPTTCNWVVSFLKLD
jgi:hypothetical protein